MSSLIKEPHDPLLQVEPYEVEDMTPEEDAGPVDSGGVVQLPVHGLESSSYSGHSQEESPVQEEPPEESLEERLARLEREAYEKGFEQGRKDGLDLEQRQLMEKGKELDALFKEISDLKGRIYSEAEGELLELSLLIAERILHREVETDPRVIRETIRAALSFVADRSRVRILIHPEDMEEVQRMLPDLAAENRGRTFQVAADPAVERGGCVLETGFGRLNATLKDQIEVIKKELEEEFSGKLGEDS
ncbi:MAG: hypothetical protein JRF57_03585 [Deltaproteobacteria bacterium]|nr:hypothetical protein [Deltaproteobacteria bacterium]